MEDIRKMNNIVVFVLTGGLMIVSFSLCLYHRQLRLFVINLLLSLTIILLLFSPDNKKQRVILKNDFVEVCIFSPEMIAPVSQNKISLIIKNKKTLPQKSVRLLFSADNNLFLSRIKKDTEEQINHLEIDLEPYEQKYEELILSSLMDNWKTDFITVRIIENSPDDRDKGTGKKQKSTKIRFRSIDPFFSASAVWIWAFPFLSPMLGLLYQLIRRTMKKNISQEI